MRIKRCGCLLLACALLLLCGCAGRSAGEAAPPDDKYRNWYEVFVWSYADSDGDGIGDLRGLAGKLDYIRSLGCTGIWLMPIMPSPSYHKYDVTDYYDIDPQYGTLEDFKVFLSSAHDKGIRVILDLPVNHTSSEHPWFLSAAEGPGSPYRDYCNWSDTPRDGYTEKNGAWYESRFVDSMPDLNLNNPDVRAEIENILRFWLEDVGIDGFRLDAVTSYYTGDLEENQEFLTWLGDTAHGIRPDSYLVGEAWDSLAAIARYAESSVDSFFLFPASQSEGWIAKILSRRSGAGAALGNYLEELETAMPENTIPAPFLENHDTGRTVGFTGRQDPVKTKMAGGLLCILPGSVFIYYGQEIGMVGSGNDPNKRIGMLWTSPEETTTPPPGATSLEYAYPPVSEQETDPASLLRYYRAALSLRNKYPAIPRGETEILNCEDANLCLCVRTWEDASVLLAVNPSRSEAACTLEGWTLEDMLLTGEAAATLESGVLAMPACSIAVLLPEER